MLAPNVPRYVGTWNQPVMNQHENGNMSINNEDKEYELSFAVGPMNNNDIQSINDSLKGMGLSLNDPNVWIGDTGATTHNTVYACNSINHHEATKQDNIMGVTGIQAKAMTIIDIPCKLERKGKKEKILLKDVTYVPESRYNLFSLTKLITNRWTMSSKAGQGIKMSKGEHELNFDKTIHTLKGILYVVVLKRRLVEEAFVKENAPEAANEIAVEKDEVKGGNESENEGDLPMECMLAANPITINKAHSMFGHMDQEEAREICNLYGQEITKWGFQKRGHCGKAKAKRLAVEQRNDEHIVAGPHGHRIFIDLSSVKHRPDKKKNISRPYWMMIVIEQVNCKVSEFINQKNELPEKACEAVRKLKQAGVNIKYVRLDNAGENKTFANITNNHIWDLQLTFEFT
jgi:hypothetical protein